MEKQEIIESMSRDIDELRADVQDKMDQVDRIYCFRPSFRVHLKRFFFFFTSQVLPFCYSY